MPFNLASNYLGLFFHERSPQPSGEHLVKDLRARISSAQRAKPYQAISQKLLEIARSVDPSATLDKSAKSPTAPPEVVTASNQHSTATEIFTGFFPCLTLHCRIKDVNWHIVARASVALAETADNDVRPSLWWHFEGVPDAKSRRPEESDASSYYELTNKISEQLMPELHHAYDKAARHLTSADTVRICLADIESRPFAELLDSLYAHRGSLSDITDSEPAKGLAELRDYAYDVGGLNLNDATLNLAEKVPGIKAVFCRAERPKDPGVCNVSIAGFAHPDGLGIALSRPGKSERYVRTMSAARKLSGRLAEQEIAEFNRRQADLSPQP